MLANNEIYTYICTISYLFLYFIEFLQISEIINGGPKFSCPITLSAQFYIIKYTLNI